MRSSGTNGNYTVYGIQQGTDWHSPDYSTTEHKIGQKWIDGKDIYEKTVDCGTIPNATTKTIAHNISNLDKIIGYRGYAKNPNNGVCVNLPYTYYDGSSFKALVVYTDSTNITIRTVENLSVYTESYLTLQYVKT